MRRVTKVRHLRPSRDHVAGDLETRALFSASSSRSDPQSDGRQESAAGVSSESKRAIALRHAGEGGARRGFRHDGGRIRRVEGGEMEGESCWKSGGGRMRLYTWPRVSFSAVCTPDSSSEWVKRQGAVIEIKVLRDIHWNPAASLILPVSITAVHPPESARPPVHCRIDKPIVNCYLCRHSCEDTRKLVFLPSR